MRMTHCFDIFWRVNRWAGPHNKWRIRQVGKCPDTNMLTFLKGLLLKSEAGLTFRAKPQLKPVCHKSETESSPLASLLLTDNYKIPLFSHSTALQVRGALQ